MRHLFLCLTTLLICNIPIWAQFSSAIKVGISDNRMVPYEETVSSRIGYNIGWEGEYDFLKWLGVKFGASVSQKGSGLRIPEKSAQYEYIEHIQHVTLDYISLPISIAVRKNFAIHGHDIGICAGGGLYYSYLFSGNASIKVANKYGGDIINNDVTRVNNIKYDSSKELELQPFSPNDTGYQFFFDINYKRFSVEAGYQYGWSTITSNGPFVMTQGCHNESLYVSVLYYLKKQ